MEHVSTLCAISTVGIAATGFALGRVERAPSRPRSSTLPLSDQYAPPRDASAAPSFKNFSFRHSKSFATPEAESPTSINFFQGHEDATLCREQVEETNSRRKPSFAGVRLRRRGQTLTTPPLRVDEPPQTPLHARRPSSSWIRRLSFQPEKRLSFQQHSSPSTTEPASPVSSNSSNPSNQRRAPNKLVKRPKSQHSNANPLFAHPPSSPLVPTAFRRPATSYQRSEAIKHKATHSLTFEPNFAISSPADSTHNSTSLEGDTWRPYLGASPDTLPERLARRFSTATKPKDQGLRRILPNLDTAPALLLATSITKRGSTTEVTQVEPTNLSPVRFRDPFESTDRLHRPETHSSEESTCHPLPSDETRPKSPTSSTGPLDVRVFRNGSFVGPKRRTISTPLPDLANVEGAMLASPRANERRNITDPNVFRRPPTTPQTEFSSGFIGPQRRLIPSYYRERATELGQFRDFGQRALSDGLALSSLHGSICQRPKRHSIAASDPVSTVIGSDDTRIFTSGDEDETDFLSDTAFDSIRTHLTTNSTYFHAPRIDTIFDKSLEADFTTQRPTQLDDIMPSSSFVRQSLNSSYHGANPGANTTPNLAPAEESVSDADDGDSHVSFPSDLTDDEDSHSMVADLPGERNGRVSLPRLQTSLVNGSGEKYHGRDIFYAPERSEIPLDIMESIENDSSSVTSESRDSSPKMNIFDWSEQPRNDRDNSGPDGRPRTVHGKNEPGMRGSRTSGRKPPNTLHYRSQSVPVAREPTISNESRQSGKFGTWGLGSKGVSEDWDSDFDFEDADESAMSENIKPNKAVNRQSVIVPQAILERQASLHGQFGQVQELTLLVEELKRLRHQASFLKIVRGPSSELWKEAEGIVDLATLDDEENNHSPPGSPSSLTFSFDDSEGESSNMNDPWKRVSGDSWRASISEHSNPRPTTSPILDHKEISTKANSVLDLIYQQRIPHGSTFIDSHAPRSKKLPFDTQSLRDLVVRAGVVTRALKEVVRKAEGVASSPDTSTHTPHPPFSRIFEQPSRDGLSHFEATRIH